MSSQSTTNKPKFLLIKRPPIYCETDREYPSLKTFSIPRHLCTCTKSLKIPEYTNINKLSNIVMTEHQNQHEKDSNRNPKSEKDEIEVIDLYQYKWEEVSDKLYRKQRHQLKRTNIEDDDDNEETRDNNN